MEEREKTRAFPRSNNSSAHGFYRAASKSKVRIKSAVFWRLWQGFWRDLEDFWRLQMVDFTLIAAYSRLIPQLNK
jgi:hypothetical protein